MTAYDLFKFCMDNNLALMISPFDTPGKYMITIFRGPDSVSNDLLLEDKPIMPGDSSLKPNEVIRHALSETLWMLNNGGYTV